MAGLAHVPAKPRVVFERELRKKYFYIGNISIAIDLGCGSLLEVNSSRLMVVSGEWWCLCQTDVLFYVWTLTR